MKSGTALVSGADRGLGLEIVRNLLDKGWNVFAGQYMPEWKELSLLAEQFPAHLSPVALDVGDSLSIRRCFNFLEGKNVSLDLLINNAAIYHEEGDIRGTMDFSRSLDLFRINSLGPLTLTKALLPLMQNGQKRLCFVSSEAGSISACWREKGAYAYPMSKSALNMAVKMLHAELQPSGFRVRLYHPGWLKTYMHGFKNEEATVEPEDSAAAAVKHFINDEPSEKCLQMMDNREEAWPF